MIPVGLQLYSLRELAAVDLAGTLEKIRNMGYTGIEFAGLYGHSAEEVKTLMSRYDLIPVSAHVPYAELMADIPGTVRTYKEIGCPYIAIPWLEEARRPGHPLYEETLEGIQAIAEECRHQGLQLLYHNHDFEFTKIDGQYALDRMYERIPAELLQTELDTCWVSVGGEDPCAYLRKYAGRAPIVHLKDYYMEGADAGPKYELIGTASQPAPKDRSSFEFRALGSGLQDMPGILRASEDAGAEWLIVELDRPPVGQTAEEAVSISRMYLMTQNY